MYVHTDEGNWADSIAFCVYTGDKLHVAQTARDEWSPAEIQKS